MMSTRISRRFLLSSVAAGSVAVLAPHLARADQAPLDVAAIDSLVESFRAEFEIPGIALAIVTAEQSLAKGYGVRALGRPEPVDEHTLFAIASNSKAFTAAALALLVDDGKIGWDEPVRTYLPDFRMYDPAVTRMLTVRDLLVHRSGLPLGAGDLLFVPPSDHKAADVLKALPYLKPDKGFRTGYSYDNILYIVAGLLIERVSGLSWQDFVERRLLRPLGMTESVPDWRRIATANVAGRHGRRGPPVNGMGPVVVIHPEDPAMIVAAGGINASAADILHWLRVQLDEGALPGGGRLWTEKQAKEMWTPQIVTSSSDGPTEEEPGRPSLSTYALGWYVRDYRGERMLRHSGGLFGQVTQTALLPGRGVGVAVYTNAEGAASASLILAVLDRIIGAPPVDWLEAARRAEAKHQQEALKTLGAAVDQAPPGALSLPLVGYAGRYRDPWYGDVVISRDEQGLAIRFVPAPTYHSRLEPWGPDAFRTHVAKEDGEDAVLHFDIEKGRVKALTMKPYSPLADFSYDFEHLHFKKI